MKLKRQSKSSVLAVTVFFSWSSIILPGLAQHALAEDQSAQSEQGIETSAKTTNTEIQLSMDQQQIGSKEAPQPLTNEVTRKGPSASTYILAATGIILLVALSPFILTACIFPVTNNNPCSVRSGNHVPIPEGTLERCKENPEIEGCPHDPGPMEDLPGT